MVTIFGDHDHSRREKCRSIASQLEGALLISGKLFPYFMLVALEAGSPLRAFMLLLISPVLWFLELMTRSEDIALRAMIFVSTVGLRVDDIKAVSRATLPKFFLQESRESAYRIFSRCTGTKYVLTRIPRIMVEHILRDYFEVDYVLGTELRVFGGYSTGLVATPGVMGGVLGLKALGDAVAAEVMGGDTVDQGLKKKNKEIDVGLGDGLRDHPFMLLCKEPYLITPEDKPSVLPRREYPKPLIFHDGRLAARPTPVDSLAISLWLPMGIVLAISRILVGLILPYKLGPMGCAVAGIQIRAQISHSISTSRPGGKERQGGGRGRLYVCCHRTLLDPVFISIALQRSVSAVTYSLSRLSEVISPIPTVRMTRERTTDDATMRRVLSNHGDLVVCPEGTTCREPYLLRFSPLFAEIALTSAPDQQHDIVPVAVVAEGSMFYGTSVRGFKCLDSFFYLMNPIPSYQVQFLDHINLIKVARAGANKYEIANQVQELIGRVLGFKCTNLTRKDKYQMLAGTDGLSST